MTKLLRTQAKLSLSESKGIVDNLLESNPISVTLFTHEEALQLARDATVLGVICEIEDLPN